MKKQKNRGITLVALIITIIVMLILLGVSVDLIIDGKIFTQAETAVNKTNDKVDAQQGRVDELMGELDSVIQSQCEHKNKDANAKCTDCGIQLITFTIDDVPYYALPDMTWGEWVNSENFNPGGLFVLSAGNVKMEGKVVAYNDEIREMDRNVIDDDLIVSAREYYMVSF